MEKLSFPAACALLTEQEQRDICGGGELSDAAKDFFGNLHFEGFSWGTAFVAVSFTFVPFLLFKLVRTGFGLAKTISDNVAAVSAFGTEATTRLGQTIANRKDPASN